MRCKENFQGDRCKKERGHHFETHPERDETHQGDFTAWRGEAGKQTVEAKAKGAVPSIRKANLKKVDKLIQFAKDQEKAGNRKMAIGVLDFVVKGLDRGQREDR